MLLYVIVSDSLARRLENSKDVNGFLINKYEVKSQQYGDDFTAMIVNLTSLDKIFDIFERPTGHKLNTEKTNILAQYASIAEKLYNSKYRQYVRFEIKILGQILGADYKRRDLERGNR